MNCRDFAAMVSGGQAEDPTAVQIEAIERHARDCEACHAFRTDFVKSQARLRDLLGNEALPVGFDRRISTVLDREDARLVRRRWIATAIPAALAASVALLLFRGQSLHDHDDHGPVIDFAVAQFLSLQQEAARKKVSILDPDLLRREAEEVAVLDGEKLRSFYRELFGEDAKIPEKLRGRGVQGAVRQVGFHGTPVSNLILDLQDQEVSVYRLRRDQALLRDLHLLDGVTADGLRIERCRSCHVIAVTRGDSVFVLVSRDGIEPMISLMRQTY